MEQIEAFVESIYPSQTARTIKQQKPNAEDAEASKDVMYIMIAMIGTFVLITLSMVKLTEAGDTVHTDIPQFGIAYLFGARFDLALARIKQGDFRPFGSQIETHDYITGASKQEL